MELAIWWAIVLTTVEPLRVPVGHITSPKRSSAAFDEIFNMVIADAHQDGLLTANDSYSFELHQSFGCGFETAATAAFELVTVHNVSAIIGPICSPGAETVGMFAAWAWDIPVLVYAAPDPRLSDKTKYKTLVRLSAAVSEFGKATIQLLHLYNWTTVGVVIDSSTWAGKEYWDYLQDRLHREGINVSVFVDVAGKGADALTTQTMAQLREKSRILVVCVSQRSLGANYFMMEAYKANMTTPDYAYIVADIKGDPYQKLPWQADPTNAQQLLAAYQQTFVIMASASDDKAVDAFAVRLLPIISARRNLTLDHLGPSLQDYLLFYDCATLYIKAVLACMRTFDCRWNSGAHVVRQMLNQSFNGATGNVVLEANFERAPPFYVSGFETDETSLAHYFSFDVDASKAESGYMVKVLRVKVWLTANGQPPLAIPPCGFENEHLVYGSLVMGVSLVLALVAVFIYHMKKRAFEEQILAMSWLIKRGELLLALNSPLSLQNLSETSVAKREATAAHRIAESAGPKDLENDALTTHSGEYLGTASLRGAPVALKHCLCTNKLPLQQNRRTLLRLKQLTDAAHGNLNTFAGICLNSNNVLTIVWNFCQKGSLQDILYNEEIKLDSTFQSSILKDIVRGLDYLHRSPIGVHGRLSAANCLVDSRWVVKLADFGLHQILNEFVQNKSLYWKPETMQGLYHVAPEVCCSYNDRGPTVLPTQTADVYSLGIVMFQVLFRHSPYDHIILSPTALIAELKNPETAVRPAIAEGRRDEHHANLVNLITSCCSRDMQDRPRLSRIKHVLNRTLATFSSNLVDHMVGMMERYAKNLEQMVESRTAQLQGERKRSDNLINRMLPKSVAERLKLGLAVDAESFESVTIFFSDIVGFTQLCGQSTPMQIVDMLNELYSLLDEIIEHCDAYKVETIGDSYLVVSGLPVRNGDRHVVEIADMSLRIIEGVKSFQIAHLPKGRVEVRVGVHTGPAAAGVIGIVMPHYCLFGDSVNTASRMEQTSIPMRIQMTQQSHDALTAAAPGVYDTFPRGSVEIKGKGLCETFWLAGRQAQRQQAIQPAKRQNR